MKKDCSYDGIKCAIEQLPVKTRRYMKDHIHAQFIVARDNGWLDSLLPIKSRKVTVTKEYIENVLIKHSDIHSRHDLRKYIGIPIQRSKRKRNLR